MIEALGNLLACRGAAPGRVTISGHAFAIAGITTEPLNALSGVAKIFDNIK